jgi:hypothetical protein
MKGRSEVLGMGNVRLLPNKCHRYFILMLLLIYGLYLITTEQSLCYKVLFPENLKVWEFFYRRNILYFVAESNAKFHTKSGRIFIIAHCPFT